MASLLHSQCVRIAGIDTGLHTASQRQGAPRATLPPTQRRPCGRSPGNTTTVIAPAQSNALYTHEFRPQPGRGERCICMATEEVAAMAEEIELEAEEKMEKSIEALKGNFNSVRTGRASGALLDRVEVQYYGVPCSLKSLAQVTVPDSSTIMVSPFDKSSLTAIEKALLQSDVGVTPSNDGRVIRLNIPPLTEERRKELTKIVAKMAEEGKVAVRNVRRDALAQYKKLEKDGKIGEDNLRDYTEDVQELTDNYVKKIETMFKAKEKELTTV